MPESDFEANLRQLRRDKLKQIEALGQQAYPNSYAFTHDNDLPQLRKTYKDATAEELEAAKVPVSLAGRLMAIRVQGKAGFAQLQQGGERLQIYVRKDTVGEDQFALYKLLDLGDHIGVRGHLFRTRTGELTVHVEPLDDAPALTFLAKAMLALPDKYHGLEDTELRYRQRYVDLFMNTGHAPKAAPDSSNVASADEDPGAPSSPKASLSAKVGSPEATPETEPLNVREVFVKRAAILRAIRKFFDDRGFLEVETPMLHTIAGGAAARPFTTHHNALDIPLSLRIAPELFLKRLVVGGLDRVYEINRNFRNEGVSTRHNPEFTMLEFYQAYANYHDLMNLTQELITFVATAVNGTAICNFNGNEIDLGSWTKLTMRQAITKFWPDEAGDAPTDFEFSDLRQLSAPINRIVRWAREKFEAYPTGNLGARWAGLGEAQSLIDNTLQYRLSSSNREAIAKASLGKAVATIFESMAEPHLIQPTIIYDFPLAVSPLSKQKPDDPDWVERFEFYIGGFEVGNAFSELNDPDEQRKRFEAQLAERDRGDDEAHQMDEDYVRALGYGLPPTAGEGIGIDRLTMILTGAKSIRDVILFPLMRPQKPQQEPTP